MIRIFIDEHRSGSDDLFVKIDGRLSHVWVADTSWLVPFFTMDDVHIHSLNDEELVFANKADVASLIRLYQSMLFSEKPIY
jgi:hypothetical protein